MKLKFPVFFILMCMAAASVCGAFNEVSVGQVKLQEKPPFQYKVTGKVVNETPQPREVVLRAQVVFFDKSSPPGDIPIHVLRKDVTVVLKPSEERKMEIPIIIDGRLPDVRLRIEPQLRIRRQRLWMNRYEDPNPEANQN